MKIDISHSFSVSLKNYYIGFGLLLHSIALFNPTFGAAQSDAMAAQTLRTLDRDFPYEATDMSAEQSLSDFSRLTGLPVEGVVAGTISVSNSQGTASDYLDRLAEQTGSVWWFDGLAIRIEPRAEMKSVVMGTRGIDITTLESAMSFVGLTNERFVTRMSQDGTLFNVIGPEGYVGAVEQLLDEIIAARKSRRTGLPVVYRGEFLDPEDDKKRAAAQTAGSIEPQTDER